MRLLLSGGGTGGHVYPALAVLDELRSGASASDSARLDDVLYIGTVGGLEAKIVTRAGVRFEAVEAGGLRGLSLHRAASNGLALLKGCAQAFRILRGFGPDVVLATGGYASAPAVVAAWLRRCPVLIYLPDIVPGLAVRALARLAKRVAVSFDASLRYFRPGKAVVTGYPVRRGLQVGDREAAKKRLGLAPDVDTVLLLGGSRGAHSINKAGADALPGILEMAQVVHVTGERDHAWLRQTRDHLREELQQRYHPHIYLHEEMVDALQAADLAVARAGAATMGEFAAVGLPSVLVPYPYSGRHQEANADYMVQRGAARKLEDESLAHGALGPVVEALLADREQRQAMAQSARDLAKPDAARAIVDELYRLVGGR